MQSPDHGEREKTHNGVNGDIDDTDGCVPCYLVPAFALNCWVPVLLDRTADQEADEYGHDEPARLNNDDAPCEVLSSVSGLSCAIVEDGAHTMNVF